MKLTADALRRNARFAHSVNEVTVHETHLSFVVLTGEYAYKIKKPVRYEFVDQSTLDRRLHLCHEELRLNRRLAAELYLEVAPISDRGDEIHFGDASNTVDYAVRMRQFEPDLELHALLLNDRVSIEDVTRLGLELGEFHATAAITTKPSSCVEAFQAALLQTRRFLAQPAQRYGYFADLESIEAWLDPALVQVNELLGRRARAGRVRECHGDLHARNVVRWSGRLVPFDCLEFDPSLRWIDVMNDMAFLTMDLRDHGKHHLASACLSSYLEQTGDYEGLQLLRLFEVYRALVRAKVDILSARQDGARADYYRDRFGSRLRTALASIHPRLPQLFITHGLSGSGKSWLAAQLVPRILAVRVRSDLERKRMAHALGLKHEEMYALAFNERTYERLLHIARLILSSGFSVLIDAAFLKRAERDRFAQLAREVQSPFRVLWCEADESTLERRIVERQAQGQDPSDADLIVLERQRANYCPPEPDEQVIRVRTTDIDAVEHVWQQVRAIS